MDGRRRRYLDRRVRVFRVCGRVHSTCARPNGAYRLRIREAREQGTFIGAVANLGCPRAPNNWNWTHVFGKHAGNRRPVSSTLNNRISDFTLNDSSKLKACGHDFLVPSDTRIPRVTTTDHSRKVCTDAELQEFRAPRLTVEAVGGGALVNNGSVSFGSRRRSSQSRFC